MNTVIVAAGGMGGLSGLWQTDNYDMGFGLAIGILACLPVFAAIYLGLSAISSLLRRHSDSSEIPL